MITTVHKRYPLSRLRTCPLCGRVLYIKNSAVGVTKNTITGEKGKSWTSLEFYCELHKKEKENIRRGPFERDGRVSMMHEPIYPSDCIFYQKFKIRKDCFRAVYNEDLAQELEKEVFLKEALYNELQRIGSFLKRIGITTEGAINRNSWWARKLNEENERWAKRNEAKHKAGFRGLFL